jgi:glycosyltransferase involved in cell wall biosynthesis
MRPYTSHGNPWGDLGFACGYPIVHWHWLNRFYQSRTLPRFLARSVLFAASLAVIRLRGTKMVFTVHNLIPHDCIYPGLHRLINRYMGLVMHRLLVHSEDAVDAVAAVYGGRSKIRIVEHVDFEPVPPVSDGPAGHPAVDALRPPGSRPFVLAFGTVRRYKRLERLLAAADALDKLGIDVVIAGKPAESFEPQVRAWAEGKRNVTLRLGFIEEAELSAWQRAAGAVIFCHAEGSLTSGAAHMALAHGVPVVSSSAIAFQEMIRLGLAFPHDPHDPQSMAEAIAKAIHADRSKFQAQRQAYRDRGSLDTIGRKLRAIYEELLRPTRP